MSSLPIWAQCAIVAPAVLLSPVLTFLMAIAAEILIGLMKDSGVPALLALVFVGAISGLLFRKLPMCPQDSAPNCT
jgi:hypothetical protein